MFSAQMGSRSFTPWPQWLVETDVQFGVHTFEGFVVRAARLAVNAKTKASLCLYS